VSRSPLGDAVDALARGELVVLPTDTVYGLAARPDAPGATERVFRAKSRPRSLTLPLLVADLPAARDVAVLSETAERAARAWWPGPATLVLPRAPRSRAWDLGDEHETVGVRVPDEPLALELLRTTGPLAVTSANRSGDPPGRTCEELVGAFGDAVAVFLCRDDPLEGVPSAVLDLTVSPPSVLRAGGLSAEDLRRFIAGEDPLLDSGTLR
jgi:tRNA threonylcarbamoyl adenosine modification protein (Sua5/YciO/YrdC/YwlC family)